MKKVTIGFAMCGSYCTFEKSIEQLKHLVEQGAVVTVLIERCDSSSYFSLCGLDKKVNVYYGNITDGNLIEQIIVEQKIETIFHLCAIAL